MIAESGHQRRAAETEESGRAATGRGGEAQVELVVGLGNPGERYLSTRHNLGFRVVDELAARHGNGRWAHRRLCDVTSTDLGPRLLLAKPLTYMNRSGEAVAWLLDHLDLEPDQMLVALDDVDLPLGTLRLRGSGGPGTHNGLRDICDRVGRSFPRIRLGVGPDVPPTDLADYVLAPFDDGELAAVERLVARAVDAVESAVRNGLQTAMSVHNGPTPTPGPETTPTE